MGRTRSKRSPYPPRFHVKGASCYHVTYGTDQTTGKKRRHWHKLGPVTDYAACLDEYYKRERGTAARVQVETVADLVVEFRRYGFRKADGSMVAEKTRENYERAIANLLDVFGEARLDEVKPHHVASYTEARSARGAANTEQAVLSKMYRMAIRRGWCETNPAAGLGYNKLQRRERYLTDAEFAALYDAIAHYESPKPGQRDIAWIFLTIAYATGLRVGDVGALRLSDFHDGALWVRESKAGVKKRYPLQRDGGGLTLVGECYERALALPGRVRSVYLLPTRTGEQYKYSGLRSLFRRLSEKAGLTDVRIHDIRKRAATDAVERGDRAQDFTGHRTEKEANGYVVAAAFRAVEPLSKRFDNEKIVEADPFCRNLAPPIRR